MLGRSMAAVSLVGVKGGAWEDVYDEEVGGSKRIRGELANKKRNKQLRGLDMGMIEPTGEMDRVYVQRARVFGMDPTHLGWAGVIRWHGDAAVTRQQPSAWNQPSLGISCSAPLTACSPTGRLENHGGRLLGRVAEQSRPLSSRQVSLELRRTLFDLPAYRGSPRAQPLRLSFWVFHIDGLISARTGRNCKLPSSTPFSRLAMTPNPLTPEAIPLPQLPGPKLAPFTPSARADIEFIQEIGNRARDKDSIVWKVRINGSEQCYALKMVHPRHKQFPYQIRAATNLTPPAS